MRLLGVRLKRHERHVLVLGALNVRHTSWITNVRIVKCRTDENNTQAIVICRAVEGAQRKDGGVATSQRRSLGVLGSGRLDGMRGAPFLL